MFGLKSLHPLISIVDLKEATRFPMHVTMNYGVYALFLKQTRCGDIRYGRQTYDYQEGTVTSFAPGQVVEVQLEDLQRSAPPIRYRERHLHRLPEQNTHGGGTTGRPT